jgi:hypothetical protein
LQNTKLDIKNRLIERKKEHALNITIRWPHHSRRNPQHILNNLPRPSQFRNNLLIAKRRQLRMTPCMHSNLMTSHILRLKSLREFEASRADGEEGGVERFLTEEVEQVGGVVPWTVVVGETPGVLVGAGCDIGRAGASGTGPPAGCVGGAGDSRGTGT